MVKNILHTFFTRIFSSASNLAIAIIISNVFGATVKGEQGLLLTTITLVTLITAIIGAGSLVYLTPRVNTKHLIVPSYLWNILVCISLYFIIRQFHLLSSDLANHALLLSFILSLSHVHTGLLMGAERIKQGNLAFLLNSIMVLAGLLVFIFIFKIPSVYAYVYALYLGYSLNFVLTLIMLIFSWKTHYQPIRIPGSTWYSGALNLLKYGFLNQLDVIAQMMSFRLSYYFIDYFVSKSAVGIYSNAISIVESIWLISRSISAVQNARIANSANRKYAVDITINLLKISFVLVFIAVFVLALIPESFYQFVFGPEFGAIRLVILSIAPGILLFSMSFILSGLFAGTGKYLFNTIASIAGLLVTLLLAFFLIKPYGLVGAGITASASYILAVSVKLVFFLKYYPVSLRDFILKRGDLKNFLLMLKDR